MGESEGGREMSIDKWRYKELSRAKDRLAEENRRLKKLIIKYELISPAISKQMHDLLCDVLTEYEIKDTFRSEIKRVLDLWKGEEE